MSLVRRLLVQCTGFLVISGTLHAELPPEAYQNLQEKAPEVLKIRADEVISKSEGIFDRSNWSETVQATVLAVTRTESGLKSGDKITLHYTRRVPKAGWVGPSPPAQLKKGHEYTAYLAKGGDGRYSLAARGMSFSPLK
jgi:hypothetical protein